MSTDTEVLIRLAARVGDLGAVARPHYAAFPASRRAKALRDECGEGGAQDSIQKVATGNLLRRRYAKIGA